MPQKFSALQLFYKEAQTIILNFYFSHNIYGIKMWHRWIIKSTMGIPTVKRKQK